jgi:hypothetical protein
MKGMKDNKNRKVVAIQDRIEEVMNEEFEKMIAESGKDPLLKLIREGKIDSLSLEQIKMYLKGAKDE